MGAPSCSASSGPSLTLPFVSPEAAGVAVAAGCQLPSRSGTAFQVWGHGGEQHPGDAGRAALLERLAAVPVLCGQQADVQEHHPEDRQHHQQDGSEKAGAPEGQASWVPWLPLRKVGEGPKERQTPGTAHTGRRWPAEGRLLAELSLSSDPCVPSRRTLTHTGKLRWEGAGERVGDRSRVEQLEKSTEAAGQDPPQGQAGLGQAGFLPSPPHL